VCDTLLQATADEIGSTKICPDCFSSMEVKPPPPKPRRVNPVVVSDYAHDDYTLSEPAELSIYRPSAEDANPRTIGEEALRNARLAQAERERGTPELPLHPLIKGVFGFLPHAPTITRVASTGCLAGFCLWLFLTEIRLMQGTASQWFFAVGGAVALLFGLLITVSYGASSLLTVLQESAEGSAAVESWPENSLAEWITESFALLMAVFFASLPGVLFTIAWNAVGLPWAAAWIVTGVTFYALFPIVQLSILETATLTNPISTPVLQSLRDQFLLWATFYLITFFLLLAVSIPLTAVRGTHPLPVFLALGLYLSLASFIYFRLLGRLAWACQMRPIEKKKNVASTGPKVGEKDR
jgi:hypothetical protein